jgi:uncharacterized membrane protein
MMNHKPMRLIVASFGTQSGAEAARKALKASRDAKMIGIRGSAAVQKDGKGQIHFKDVGMTPGKGAAEGAVLGAVAGLLTGGTAIALGAAGAVVGGLVGKKRQGARMADQRLSQLAGTLVPESSALVVMEPGWGVVVAEELQRMGADVFSADIPAGVGSEIEAQGQGEFEALLKQRKGEHRG